MYEEVLVGMDVLSVDDWEKVFVMELEERHVLEDRSLGVFL